MTFFKWIITDEGIKYQLKLTEPLTEICRINNSSHTLLLFIAFFPLM